MQLRFLIYLMDGRFVNGQLPIPSGWIHIVLNYIGPDNGQGIRIYEDGVLTGSEVTKSGGTYSAGDGRVVVGRPYVDLNVQHGWVNVDELLFFNQSLNDQQVWGIKNIF